MITKDDMIDVLIDACPSFAPQWQAFQREWRAEGNDLPLYLNGTFPEQFRPYLGPVSARWWDKLYRFWQHGELLIDDQGHVEPCAAPDPATR
jgi:hypothetical protein